MWPRKKSVYSNLRNMVHYEREGIRDFLNFKYSFFYNAVTSLLWNFVFSFKIQIYLNLINYPEKSTKSRTKVKTNQFWFPCHVIHVPINIGIKKSPSFTCTCFKLSEMWSAFVVSLQLKIKDFFSSLYLIPMFIGNTL